jgi:2-methylaconitate cis-trans-isomerase PrpF
MTFIPQTIIDQAADLIVNTRDFCGNEQEAVRDFAIENGFKAEWKKIHGIANFRANARWNGFKKAAGVNPKHIF